MFNIGDTLNKFNYTQGAIWANEHGARINPENWVIEEVPAATGDELSEQKRRERDFYLSESDKKMLPDYPISDDEKKLWASYRQYLRDIPDDSSFPEVDVLNFQNWLEQIHAKEPNLE